MSRLGPEQRPVLCNISARGGSSVERLEGRLFLAAQVSQPVAPEGLGDLTAEIATKDGPDPRVALLANQKAVLRVTVRNVGDAPIVGRTSVMLLAQPFGGEANPGP